MRKQSSLPSSSAVAEIDTQSFGKVFLLKQGTLETVPEFPKDKEAIVRPFKSDAELAGLIAENRETLFGPKVIGLSGKLQDGSFPWFAFLFDFSAQKPRCYLLLVMPYTTDSSTFLQRMVDMFAFMERPGSREVILNAIRGAFKTKMIARAFERLHAHGADQLEEALTKRWKCLIVTDHDPVILGWFKSAFAHSWAKFLEVITLQKFHVGKQILIGMHPASLQPAQEPVKAPREKVIHDEAHHLAKGSQIVQSIYKKLKAETGKIASRVQFNPSGKHYIAMKVDGGKNLAFFHFRKNTMYIVVKLDEKIVRKLVKKNTIQSLPGSVQTFWNGASTALLIDSVDHLKEVVEIFKKLIK